MGAMAGEISPDMMFFGVCQKCSNMGADGRRWMRMGAIGCVSTGMHKNKAKRAPNGQAGHTFERMVKCKKCSMLAWMVMVIKGEQGEQKRGSKGREVQAK